MNLSRLAISAMVLLSITAGMAAAVPDAPAKGKGKAKPLRAAGVDNSKTIDINNMSMFVTNTGSFAWDKGTGAAGLEFPKGTGKTAVFAAGMWLGAQVAGKIRVSVSEYSDDYQPGQAVGGVADDPTKAEYKTYKLNRVYTDTAERDAALADYTAGAVPHGAPAVAVQGDGSLNIVGDQMLWAVYNDMKYSGRNDASGKVPLGVEVQQTTFAFNRQGALGNTVFIKYKIINRSASTLTNMYVSQWSDPDLGGAGDDLVGCDTLLSLGYVYNATASDEQYGAQSPSVGYDFLQGPKVGSTVLGLSSFNKYINGTDPDDSTKSYNYMQGLYADGSTIINPTNGQPTNFQVSGDPVLGSGWLDSAPADRRLQLSSGPFTMAPLDSQEIVCGIVVGQSSNRLASISLMKFYDSSVQAAYDANFNLPSPPNSPTVTATSRAGSIFLSWLPNAETYNQPPYAFEGYNIYQGASIAGPFTRIATYDLVNGVTTVLDDDFNEEQGLILPTGKAFGTDVGVRYQIELSEDKIRGGPLYDGQTYYFTVTAYSVGLGETPQVLESAYNVLTVVPQPPAAGVDLSSAQVTAPAAAQITPGPAGTTDVVTATIIDPATVVTADWQVGFKPNGASTVWYLTRTVGSVTDTVVNNWPNVSGDDNYPIIDGVQVKVVSFPLGELARITYEDVGPNAPGIDGVDVGLRFFAGGGDYAADLFGSAIPSHSTNTHNVEMRFTGGATGQYAYRYLRTLDSGDNRVYFIQDYVPVPFSVWDTDANIQLNAAFLENAGPPPAANMNNQWDPNTSGDGGREIVWILDQPYFGDTTPDSAYFNDPDLQDILAGNLDARYAVWPYSTGTIDNGDKLLFTTSIPNTPNDYFTFSSTAANQMNVAMGKSQLDLIKAVPNPYFAHSSYELTQFARVVKFTHLPAQCTIRLFNLAGDLVRTIEKNDGTSQATWNLQTENGLPIGSGIYVYHITAGSLGTKVGKVAIFMEKERLNNY